MKKTLLAHWFIGLAYIFPAFVNANTYTFTSAGATGREGPTQAQVDANYTGTTLDGAVTINTQGIQALMKLLREGSFLLPHGSHLLCRDGSPSSSRRSIFFVATEKSFIRAS